MSLSLNCPKWHNCIPLNACKAYVCLSSFQLKAVSDQLQRLTQEPLLKPKRKEKSNNDKRQREKERSIRLNYEDARKTISKVQKRVNNKKGSSAM